MKNPSFQLMLRAFWEPIAASKSSTATLIPDWWENTAKPSLVAFCRSFSALLAAKRCQTRCFLTYALALALVAMTGPLWSSAAAKSETWMHGLLWGLPCGGPMYPELRRRSLTFSTWLLRGALATPPNLQQAKPAAWGAVFSSAWKVENCSGQ
jgi:hypothetical protein